MAATSFYVNASRGEGLCLPLMEFMSAGVPAIAPDHTTMADYVAGDTTFVVSSSTEPTAWPNDPLMRITTSYRRINWSSLADQFRASYEVATQDPTRYRDMSRAAVATQAHYSADAVVADSNSPATCSSSTQPRRSMPFMTKRTFLVYCPVTDETITSLLGQANYSYYFVMKRFTPLLAQLGEVRQVLDLAELDGG